MRAANWMKMSGALVAAGTMVGTAGPAMAAPGGTAYTCTNGAIGSGTYTSVTVTGMCGVMPGAMINVTGNLNVAPGAVFDAQSAPATITVGKNVTAGAGSMLGLGCQPGWYVHNSGHACADPYADGISDITVNGNVTATDAMAVLLNGITVHGNVTITGGGSEEIPWSIKNDTIDGNLTVSGQTTTWLGVLFNRIGKNVSLSNITLHDPDPGAPGVYVGHNVIAWNLNCFNLQPGVSGGFGPVPNTVGRNANGQCAGLV